MAGADGGGTRVSFLSEHVREVTGAGPDACSSQESCAGLLVRLMTLIHVSYRGPCDPVMHC